jgi:hypothetical protein
VLTDKFIEKVKEQAEQHREQHRCAERKIEPEIIPFHSDVKRKIADPVNPSPRARLA